MQLHINFHHLFPSLSLLQKANSTFCFDCYWCSKPTNSSAPKCRYFAFDSTLPVEGVECQNLQLNVATCKCETVQHVNMVDCVHIETYAILSSLPPSSFPHFLPPFLPSSLYSFSLPPFQSLVNVLTIIILIVLPCFIILVVIPCCVCCCCCYHNCWQRRIR